ncbi:phosphotransferase [Nocardia sp. NPDC006630]|uniref:phosphotransferase family protein n=1 Tax=Nocardia sp. NPDC006630 TaxID=3157181 RepID=UPI0033B56A3C
MPSHTCPPDADTVVVVENEITYLTLSEIPRTLAIFGGGYLLSDVTQRIYQENHQRFGPLYRKLGVPEDPLSAAIAGWRTLESRPFRLVHADVHRKNMIIQNGRNVVFLDWELALFGDPLYDVVSHLHKMGYQPNERSDFLAQWTAAEPEAATGRWEADLQTYLNHERIKSVIVDSVRYAKVLKEGSRTTEQEQALVVNLVAKLTAAHEIWATGAQFDPEFVESELRACS